MQEEIGTGGGGFRFMYASFLKEAAGKLNRPILDEASSMMTEAGDKLREFALIGARLCKQKQSDGYAEAAQCILDAADAEESAHRLLLKNL
jgi:uncharacterized protein DUF4872